MRLLLMKTQMMKYKQSGATLMEVMVAMSISLVVTASMIALMASTLGSTARIVKMTRLSDDMRVALQLMSRDVRRTSYNINSIYCYANDDCDSDGATVAVGDITINGGNDCLVFLTDREHDNYASDIAAGGFRKVLVDPDGDGTDVGVIEMWTGTGDPTAICDAAAGASGWVQITNPDNMDIFEFSVDDDLSYTQVVKDDGAGDTVSQRVRKVRMDMQGRLVLDNTIVRRMEDIISLRNDLLL
jgi:type II secretory pathway pseudopilin PulG